MLKKHLNWEKKINIVSFAELEGKIKCSIVRKINQIIRDGMSDTFCQYLFEKNQKFIFLPLIYLMYFEFLEINVKNDYFEYYPKNFRYF